MARAHSHAAPPSSINTPVDNEKVFAVTRIAGPWKQKLNREAHNLISCGVQRLSTMQAVQFIPRRDGAAGWAHGLGSVARHLYSGGSQSVQPDYRDGRNEGRKNAETNRTGVHKHLHNRGSTSVARRPSHRKKRRDGKRATDFFQVSPCPALKQMISPETHVQLTITCFYTAVTPSCDLHHSLFRLHAAKVILSQICAFRNNGSHSTFGVLCRVLC